MWISVKRGKLTTQIDTDHIMEAVMQREGVLSVSLTLVDGSTRIYTPENGKEFERFLKATGLSA